MQGDWTLARSERLISSITRTCSLLRRLLQLPLAVRGSLPHTTCGNAYYPVVEWLSVLLFQTKVLPWKVGTFTSARVRTLLSFGWIQNPLLYSAGVYHRKNSIPWSRSCETTWTYSGGMG